MDFGIKEIGITIIVGAFFLLGLELILFYFFNRQFTGFFQGQWGLSPGKPSKPVQSSDAQGLDKQVREETKDHAIKAAVFIGLAFAVGILAEDLSYKYVDSVEPPKPLPESVSFLELPSKGDTRIKTLIKKLKDENPVIDPLTTELASNGAFSLADPTNGDAVKNWICDGGHCTPKEHHACPSTKDDIPHTILRVYYYAKNRTFEVGNYYDEMKRIQARVDFSRSIALIALIYCVLAALLVLGGIIRIIYSQKKSILHRDFIFQSIKANYKRFAVLLVLFVIYFAGMWSYERESNEFNKRAFGYYASMLIKENQNKSVGCNEGKQIDRSDKPSAP